MLLMLDLSQLLSSFFIILGSITLLPMLQCSFTTVSIIYLVCPLAGHANPDREQSSEIALELRYGQKPIFFFAVSL